MNKKIFLGLLVFFILIVVAFKPLSKFAAESYLTYKLENPVTIQNYRLFPFNADISIVSLKLGDEQLKDVKTNLKLSHDTLLTLSSFEHEKLKSEDLRFDYNLSSGDFKAKGDVEIVGFDSLHLQTQGNYQEDNISAAINGTFTKESEFDFVAKVNREANATRVHLDANTFGGVLELSFEDTQLTLLAKSMQLKKIFQELKQEPIAQGNINLKAILDIKTLQTKLSIFSKKIVAYGQNFEDVKFGIKDFNYENKKLNLTYGLDFTQNEKKLHFDGSAEYKDKLKFSAETEDFGAKINFVLEDKNIRLDALHVSTQTLLVFLKEKPYISGNFDLHVKGDFENLDIQLEAPQLITSQELFGREENLTLRFVANYTPKKVTFTPYVKSSMLEFVKGTGTYDIAKKELYLNQKFRVKYKKIDAPLSVQMSYKDAILKAKTLSLGGETEIEFQENRLNAKLTKLNLKTLDRMFLKEDILQKGKLSGTLFYDLQKKKGKSVLHVEDGVVSGVDLDAKLGTLMNAVGLNIFSLKNELFDDDKTLETKITHLEFDVKVENGKIHLVDSAFSTPKFRIAALGDFNQSGKIEELNLNLLDKNGCSIIKQEISGTLSEPVLENKILTTTDVIVSIPSEVLKNPKKLLDFSTNLVDKTATFLLGLTHLSDANVTLTSDISSGALNLVDKTSSIVLKDCKVVYDGKIKAIKP